MSNDPTPAIDGGTRCSLRRLNVFCPDLFVLLQIFGLESILGSDNLWPLLLALTILPAIVQSIMLPFCPESPRYLLIVLNKEEEARKGGCSTQLHN